MANTREILGDQATLDGLIGNTLTEFEESEVRALRARALQDLSSLQSIVLPNVQSIRGAAFANCIALTNLSLPSLTTISDTYNFSGNTNIVSIVFPSATSVGGYDFNNDTALTTIDFSGSAKVTIGAHAFNGCSSLKHLILRCNEVATLSNVNAFTGTPMAYHEAAIYVPSDLIDSYKTATNWSIYKAQIYPIEDYPRATFDNIDDTWTEIISSVNDGSYSTKYAIGDTKCLDFGSQGIHQMEIVAFDEDDLADDSGKAHITWICIDVLPTTRRMNASRTTSGGYEAMELRTYLSGTILPLLPAEVQAAIVEVKKVQSTVSGGIVKDGQTTTEKLWIPSNHEVGLGTTYETTGAVYSSVFSSLVKRTKYRAGTVSDWWLRSAHNSTNTTRVNESGNASYRAVPEAAGVVPGFCI